MRPFRIQAIRSCKSVKESVFDEMVESCKVKSERLLSIASKDKERTEPPPSFQSLVDACANSAALKDARYEECFNAKLRDLTTAVLVSNLRTMFVGKHQTPFQTITNLTRIPCFERSARLLSARTQQSPAYQARAKSNFPKAVDVDRGEGARRGGAQLAAS